METNKTLSKGSAMGYCNNTHIRKFTRGQTIEDIREEKDGAITLTFKSGESLRLWPRAKQPATPAIETIATPYGLNGEVKSVEIV